MQISLALYFRWSALVALLLITSGAAFAQEPVSTEMAYNVLFNVDKSVITSSELDRFDDFFKGNLKDATSIQLKGHTDSDGSDAYNQDLSESRVIAVLNKLIALGYPEDKIEISYAGEEEPLNKNMTAAEKRVNRRVRINWEKVHVEERQLGDIRDLYKLLEQVEQVHCIDPTKDTMLRLEQGTIIGVPAFAFNTKSTECITIKAKEVFRYSDMIMENLTTTSNGRPLETGGMLYTEASDSRGDKLALTPGKSLTIMLPTETIRDDMKLFYGNRNDRGMNWNLEAGYDFRGYSYIKCDRYKSSDRCEECKILPCRLFGRIDETFKGMTDRDQHADNKEFRKCQKNLRKRGVNSYEYNQQDELYCSTWNGYYGGENWEQIQDSLRVLQALKIEELYATWGVSNQQEYLDTVQKYQQAQREAYWQDIYDEYGVSSQQEYYDTIQKIREKQAEERFEKLGEDLASGESDIVGLKYYVASATKMGWINCDAFSGSGKAKITMVIDDSRSDSETDCNLIFKDRKSMMKGYQDEKSKFSFARIISGLSVWILTIKYKNEKIFLSIESSKTGKSVSGTNFREVTVDELKTELRKLDM